jgi:hypothetical protein
MNKTELTASHCRLSQKFHEPSFACTHPWQVAGEDGVRHSSQRCRSTALPVAAISLARH